MRLFRISNYADLLGLAAGRYDARWHTATPGKRLVYLSEHVSTAVLESLVHLKKANGIYPEHYQLLTIETGNQVSIEQVESEQLAGGWQDSFTATQAFGDTWLQESRSALLRVPSVVAAQSWNCLVNPLHPDASALAITHVQRHAYDRRLFLIRS